jgi:hypothetical protein
MDTYDVPEDCKQVLAKRRDACLAMLTLGHCCYDLMEIKKKILHVVDYEQIKQLLRGTT